MLARLLPAPCVLCGLAGDGGQFCAGCRADLPWITGACHRCGRPLPRGASPGLCGGCDLALAGLDRVRAALVYEYPVDSLVAAAKFHGRPECARALGEALARWLNTAPPRPPPDLVVPVPLHPLRVARRGYNQAAVIATAVAHAARLNPAACRRRRNTPAQSGLPGPVRRVNLRDAFVARCDLSGLAVAIVDDVVTTGHTISALALTLRRAGAVSVEGWCVARVVMGQTARNV
jgi:ComF family protein